MILILKRYIDGDTREFRRIESHLKNFPNIEMRVHQVQGAEQTLTDVYLIGNTANMILVDFHPDPTAALVDGPQALRIEELGQFLDDVRIVRKAYEERLKLYDQTDGQTDDSQAHMPG